MIELTLVSVEVSFFLSTFALKLSRLLVGSYALYGTFGTLLFGRLVVFFQKNAIQTRVYMLQRSMRLIYRSYGSTATSVYSTDSNFKDSINIGLHL